MGYPLVPLGPSAPAARNGRNAFNVLQDLQNRDPQISRISNRRNRRNLRISSLPFQVARLQPSLEVVGRVKRDWVPRPTALRGRAKPFDVRRPSHTVRRNQGADSTWGWRSRAGAEPRAISSRSALAHHPSGVWLILSPSSFILHSCEVWLILHPSAFILPEIASVRLLLELSEMGLAHIRPNMRFSPFSCPSMCLRTGEWYDGAS